MAAKRLIRPTFTSETRGCGAALLPDGGEMPYPAYVFRRNPWLRGALLPDGGETPYPAYGSLL
jgi:hypothetical protein